MNLKFGKFKVHLNVLLSLVQFHERFGFWNMNHNLILFKFQNFRSSRL